MKKLIASLSILTSIYFFTSCNNSSEVKQETAIDTTEKMIVTDVTDTLKQESNDVNSQLDSLIK